METRRSVLTVQLSILILSVCSGRGKGQGLAYNYYDSTCPNVEGIVKREMFGIFAADPTAPAAFLRLLFHDCQVQGCDASILLQYEGSELQSSRNFGIRKLDAIGRIKSALEDECPRQVSCADIISLAARDAVAISGGPPIQIPLGRKDSTTSSSLQADSHLPAASIDDVDKFLQIFMSKGMNLEESVAIIGAHTLGGGHCRNIVNRLYNPKPTDQMDLRLQLQLRFICPTAIPMNNITVVPSDVTTTIFDNQYYRDIAVGKGLFPIDSTVSRDPQTMTIVRQFAVDQLYFFQTFSSAFVKLASTGVLTGDLGEVRLDCSQVN